jgi:hypothetical protein
MHTPGGVQEILCLSEHGLYFFLARSDKPAALPFQKWIAGEVLPRIRRTGVYAVAAPQQTPAEMLLASVQMLVDQERRTRALEAEQAQLTGRVAAIEQRAQTGATMALPAPEAEVDALGERALVNRVVRGAVFEYGITYREAFAKLYREFRDRTGIDLVARGRNRGRKPLDVAEDEGLLAQLYTVAHEVFIYLPVPMGDALEGGCR